MGTVVMCNCVFAIPEYVVLVFAVVALSCIGIMIFASMPCKIDGWLFVVFAALLSTCLYVGGAAVIVYFFGLSIVNLVVCGIFCIILLTFLAMDAKVNL